MEGSMARSEKGKGKVEFKHIVYTVELTNSTKMGVVTPVRRDGISSGGWL